MSNRDYADNDESVFNVWNTETINLSQIQKSQPKIVRKINIERTHFREILQQLFSKYYLKISSVSKKISDGIFQSDYWLNFYSRNHILVADIDNESRKYAFLIQKNNNYFYNYLLAKILLFMIQSHKKPITFENIRLLTFANLFTITFLPVFFYRMPKDYVMSEIEQLSSGKQLDTDTVASPIISQKNIFWSEDNNGKLIDDKTIHHDIPNTNSKSHQSINDIYYANIAEAKKYFNTKQMVSFSENFPAINKNFLTIYKQKLFYNDLLESTLFNKYWINFLNIQFSILISFSFEILSNVTEYKQIINSYIDIFKYALPLLLIKKSLNFYQKKLVILRRKKYQINNDLLLIHRDNYHDFCNLLFLFQEKMTKSIQIHNNHNANHWLLERLLKFCK